MDPLRIAHADTADDGVLLPVRARGIPGRARGRGHRVPAAARVVGVVQLPRLGGESGGRLGCDRVEGASRGGRHHGGQQALHEGRRRQPHRHVARPQLERQLCTQHGRAEVHQDQHAVAVRGELIDRSGHSDGVRAEDRCAVGVHSGSGRDPHPHSPTRDHLQGKLQGRLPEPRAVGDGDDADHQALPATAAASVSNRIAVEAAPGSR